MICFFFLIFVIKYLNIFRNICNVYKWQTGRKIDREREREGDGDIYVYIGSKILDIVLGDNLCLPAQTWIKRETDRE